MPRIFAVLLLNGLNGLPVVRLALLLRERGLVDGGSADEDLFLAGGGGVLDDGLDGEVDGVDVFGVRVETAPVEELHELLGLQLVLDEFASGRALVLLSQSGVCFGELQSLLQLPHFVHVGAVVVVHLSQLGQVGLRFSLQVLQQLLYAVLVIVLQAAVPSQVYHLHLQLLRLLLQTLVLLAYLRVLVLFSLLQFFDFVFQLLLLLYVLAFALEKLVLQMQVLPLHLLALLPPQRQLLLHSEALLLQLSVLLYQLAHPLPNLQVPTLHLLAFPHLVQRYALLLVQLLRQLLHPVLILFALRPVLVQFRQNLCIRALIKVYCSRI